MNNGFDYSSAPNSHPTGDHFGGQQFQAPPPGAPSPRPSGFFDSIRRSGWYRPELRTIGGVCAGVSARSAWDLALVRGITVVAALFFPFVLVFYALAWALLPEERDGRIHFEELTKGRFDIAHLGVLLFILLGAGFGPTIGFELFGPTSVLVSLLMGLGMLLLALVVLAVVLASRSSQPHSSPTRPASSGWTPQSGPAWTPPTSASPGPPFPAPGAARAPGASDVPFFQAPSAPHSSGGAPGVQGNPLSSPPTAQNTHPSSPQVPYSSSHMPVGPSPLVASSHSPSAWTRPPRVVFKTVSKGFNLVITGLVLLSIAATFATMFYFSRIGNPEAQIRSGLIGAGISLFIVGLALAYASFKDRGAGWLIALSLLGFFLAWPTTLVGLLASEDHPPLNFPSDALVSDHFDWKVNEIPSDSSGFVVLDLRDAPAGVSKEISVDDSLVTLTVKARKDQPIRFICNGMLEGVSTSYADGLNNGWADALRACAKLDGSEEQVSAVSPTWTKDEGITVRIPQDLLTFAYEESSPAPESSQSSLTPQSGAEAPQSAAPKPRTAPSSVESAPL